MFRSCLISSQVDFNHNYEVILITYEGILFLSWEVLDVSPWRFLILPCNCLEFRGGCRGSNCYILWHRSHCLYSGTGMKATHLHDLCCCKSFTFPTGTLLSISLELSWQLGSLLLPYMLNITEPIGYCSYCSDCSSIFSVVLMVRFPLFPLLSCCQI